MVCSVQYSDNIISTLSGDNFPDFTWPTLGTRLEMILFVFTLYLKVLEASLASVIGYGKYVVGSY